MKHSSKTNKGIFRETRLPKTSLALAISLAIFSSSSLAGKITAVSSASGADGFGGLNLNNIEVVLNPAETTSANDGTFDKY